MPDLNSYAEAWRGYIEEETGGSNPLYRFAMGLLLETGAFSRILDLGCGTAGFADELAASGVKLDRYVGVDVNAGLLAYCEEKQYQNRQFSLIDLSDHGQDNDVAALIENSDAIIALRLFNNIGDQAFHRIIALIKAAGRGRKFLYLNPFFKPQEGTPAVHEPYVSIEETEEFHGVTVRHYQRTPEQYVSAVRSLGYSEIRTASFCFPPRQDITHCTVYGVI